MGDERRPGAWPSPHGGFHDLKAGLADLAEVVADLKRQADEMLLQMVHQHNAIVDLKARVEELERRNPDHDEGRTRPSGDGFIAAR